MLNQNPIFYMYDVGCFRLPVFSILIYNIVYLLPKLRVETCREIWQGILNEANFGKGVGVENFQPLPVL